MKKKISLKVWLTVFFGGIRQFLCNIFSWKNKTPFWRVIWAAITVCIVVLTGLIVWEEIDRKNRYASWDEEYDPAISRDFKFRNNGHDRGSSYIYNSRTKKKEIKGIDWIAIPEDGDSLIIVAKDGKRGFVNRFTAEIALPFKYDAAWVFTDGVAGVCEGDSVYFIDHSGKPINNKKFARVMEYDRYVYHGNYAAIPVNGKYGLVDRNGEWILAPEYDHIVIWPKNMWSVTNNEKQGVFAPSGRFVIPVAYQGVRVHPENGITITNADNSLSRYDYDGTLLDEFVFDETFHLAYFIDEFDKNGDQKQAVDKMLKYLADGNYGLMSADGKPVTAPLYSVIECVSPGVYQCEIPNTDQYILINSKGEKINK